MCELQVSTTPRLTRLAQLTRLVRAQGEAHPGSPFKAAPSQVSAGDGFTDFSFLLAPSLRLIRTQPQVFSASTIDGDASWWNSNCDNMDETHHAEPPPVSEKRPEALLDTASFENGSRPSSVRGDAGSAHRADSEKGVGTVGRKRKRNMGRAEWRYGHTDH